MISQQHIVQTSNGRRSQHVLNDDSASYQLFNQSLLALWQA